MKKYLKVLKTKDLNVFTHTKKVSLYHSRNAACKKANGKFIAFLDVDDLWFPNKLKLQLKKFKDKKKVGLVYEVEFYKINNEKFFKKKKQLINKENLPTGYITKELLQSHFQSVYLL